MGSTLGACGDINRNVMAPPAPYKNRPEYTLAWEYANNIADLLAPQSGAYYEVWLDGEKFLSAEESPEVKAARQRNNNDVNLPDPHEPIYGTNFMPRKFKIAVTVPGDNSVDLYSQDLSLVVITNKKGELQGFNIFAGGGLGRTHNKEETFARVADTIGFVDKADIYDLVKAVVATQRDYGDRANRRHARMKYLLADWGVDSFREKVEQYLGKAISPAKPLPAFKYQDFLGWNEQGDGKLFLGLSVENGRVKDEGKFKLRTALRTIVEQFSLPMRLTPHQNVLFYDIEPNDKEAISKIFQENGVEIDPTAFDPLVRHSMACPALPTCGLAITESERALPGITDRIRVLLDKLGLTNESFTIRMTGCPNGCARPYMAELGFVGIAPDTYQVWVGGSPHQTRLAQVYQERVNHAELETHLEPVLAYFKKSRRKNEKFGDFCDRVGMEAIREFVTKSQSGETTATKTRHRVSLPEEIYNQLNQAAASQGKPISHLAAEAIVAYLQSQ